MEFRIKALDASSSVISCVVDAVDEAEARRQLALQELRVISLEPMRRLRRLFRPPQLQLAVFSQQLVSLLDAGLSLVEALEALAQKESSATTKRTLDRILARLYEGQTLAAAVAEHPATFPDLYVASVRASERTGALREALTRYIAYQQQADGLRKTLVNACIYPAVLLVAGLLVTLFLMGYVVPRFSSIYEDVGTDLPFASRVLLQWGQLIDAHTGLVVGAAMAALIGAGYGVGGPAVRVAGGGDDTPDRAGAHDRDRPDHRSDCGAHVLPHLPARREHPMNAAVEQLLDKPVPVVSAAPAAPPILVPAAVIIDEPSIARAMKAAQQANRPVLEVLA